ncbi:MAG: hypothetical protein WAQ98_14620 [Blastocatellia bacterium]
MQEDRDVAVIGLRQSARLILDNLQIEQIKREFSEIGGDINLLRFNEGVQTGYLEKRGMFTIRGDVLPRLDSNHPRSVMSSKAVLAHELGHMHYKGTILAPGACNDEFRASYWAAKYVPNLSHKERVHLIQDAISRAQESGITIRVNKFMREIMYGF